MILRPYQRRSVDAIYGYFDSGKTGNPIIALPTGSGKSVVIGTFVAEVLTQWSGQRILNLIHVRELVAQNAKAIDRCAPGVEMGIYSAGLKQRDTQGSVIVASVQSVHEKAHELGWFDLILIDECHLVPDKGNTMYRRLIAELRRYNPRLKVIGFSATPYRLTSGMLHEGNDPLFTDIALDLTQGDELVQMIDDGYLAPLRPKAMGTEIDLSAVHRRGGEFVPSELAAAVNIESITNAALDEAIPLLKGRKSTLAFCVSVDHAISVRDGLRNRGLDAHTIHGKMSGEARDKILNAFKAGDIDAVTNCDVRTTGFDHPGLDALIVLKPTESPGLHVQINGRGMRVAEGKTDCLVLDYAGNTARLGPINAIRVPSRKKRGPGEAPAQAPTKTCPKCSEIVHLSSLNCPACGHAFPPPEPELHRIAATDALIQRAEDRIITCQVHRVLYSRHENANGQSLKVTYDCGDKAYNEWVAVGRGDYAGRKANGWWRYRCKDHTKPLPESVDEAIKRAPSDLFTPKWIVVDTNKKYPEVVRHEFDSTGDSPPGESVGGFEGDATWAARVGELSQLQAFV